MNIVTLADHRGTPTQFFPGLEVVHVDEHGQEHRGVIRAIDPVPAMLTLAMDADPVSRRHCPSSSCYVPEDANVRIVVSQLAYYSFQIPLGSLDLEDLTEDYGINEVLDDWFCNQDNNERDAITYEVDSREIEPSLNRRA